MSIWKSMHTVDVELCQYMCITVAVNIWACHMCASLLYTFVLLLCLCIQCVYWRCILWWDFVFMPVILCACVSAVSQPSAAGGASSLLRYESCLIFCSQIPSLGSIWVVGSARWEMQIGSNGPGCWAAIIWHEQIASLDANSNVSTATHLDEFCSMATDQVSLHMIALQV